MISKATFALSLLVALACADQRPREATSPTTHEVVAAMPQRPAADVGRAGLLPSRAAADSLLTHYLSRIVERDGFTPNDFAGMRSVAQPCIEEQYGDVVHAYWLARGRVLGYVPAGDTLNARLELLTVAAQEPRSDSAYGSVVTARIRTDTLLLKLLPDSSGSAWLTCGLLSDGHELGGYGLPENTRYQPQTYTRTMLLRQVDSIPQAPLHR
jgi:hypothetical protein